MGRLAALCHAVGVPTLSGVADYALEGVALTLGRRARGAEIVVNLPAAREAGLDLTAQLLELARVVPEVQ